MIYAKQSTAATVLIGPFLDSTDGVTPETGLTISQADVRLSKNGGNMAQKGDATSCTHDELGYYACPLNVTDTGTLGILKLMVAESGALPIWQEIMILDENTFDTMFGSDSFNTNIIEISGDSISADNLELQYDGTGLVGETFPGTQLQVSNIGSGGSGATNHEITDDNVLGALAYGGAFVGTQVAGTYESLAFDPLDYHQIAGAGTGSDNINLVNYANVGGTRQGVNVLFQGYLNSGNDVCQIQAWDFVGAKWDTLYEIDGQNGSNNIVEPPIRLLQKHTGTGIELGDVYIRFVCDTQSNPTLYVGTLLVAAVNTSVSVGYADGAIWVDTINGAAGAIPNINGTADKKVLTWSDALLLSGLLNITRFRITNGSIITLAGNSDNYTMIGDAWNLNLNGQSIEGASFHGAISTSGIGLSVSTQPIFECCDFITATIPPAKMVSCGFGKNSGVFTGGSSGQYIIRQGYSLVPGSGSPSLIFSGLGGSTGINVRGWNGGSTFTLDSNCILSHEVAEGGGQTITTGGADVELRGLFRSATLHLSSAGTVQVIAMTGPVILDGAATSVVNLYGVISSLSNTSTGTVVNNHAVSADSVALEETLDAMAGAGFLTGTDSLESIRNRGDVAWTTGAGGSSPTVVQIREEMDSNSTQLAAIILDTGNTLPTMISALNDPTEVAIATSVWEYVIENSKSAEYFIRVLKSVLAGIVTNDGTRFRDDANTKDRVVATVDSAGNRTVMIVDGD